MPLNNKRKTQLLGVIKQMEANNEPPERIQQMVAGFQTKFGNYNKQEVAKLRAKAKGMDIPALQEQEAQQSFQQLPIHERFLAGAGRTLASTPGIKQAYNLFADEDIDKSSFEDYEKAAKGDVAAGSGEIITDAGLLFAPGLSVAKKIKQASRLGKLGTAGLVGAGEGALSAGVHQAQNLQAGRDVSGLEAGLETGLSTLLPFSGQLIGRGLKKMAPEVLQSSVKAPRKLSGKKNAPKFEEPLKQGLIPKFGGLEGAVENTSEKISTLANKRDDLIKKANIEVNLTDATRKVGAKLNNMVKNAEIDMDDAEQAFNFSENALRTAKKVTGKKGKGKVKASGSKAITLRKLADKGSKFNAFDPTSPQVPSKAVFNEAYRRVLEDEIENQITLGAGKGLSTEYMGLKKEMADLIPFNNAAKYRLNQSGNNYKLSLMDLGSLGLGSSFGGTLPAKLATAGTVGGLRRLTSTPGGAAMLYQGGKSLEDPSFLKSLLMQGGRSTAIEGGR